jgi:exosome complex component RRP42
MSENVIAEIKRDHIYALAVEGKREDGRAFDEYRPITIETNWVSKAEGSARVQIGDTKIVVGVKIQPGEPFSDTPDVGVIITNIELVPLASPKFESGPPRPPAIELARVTDRGVRESKSIDLKALCITPGEKVWMIFIDMHVLDDLGNLQDTAALGAIAALKTAHIPYVNYGLGDKDVPLPVNDTPVAITAVKIGGEIMLDPSLDEESVTTTKLTIISNNDGNIVGMQKSGTGSLTADEIKNTIRMAVEKAKEIRKDVLGM